VARGPRGAAGQARGLTGPLAAALRPWACGPGFDLDRRATDANGGVPVSDDELAQLAGSERRFAGEAEEFADRIDDLAAPERDERALSQAADALREVADRLEQAADAGSADRREEHDRAQREAYEAFNQAQEG
jgi:hypothetical protein